MSNSRPNASRRTFGQGFVDSSTAIGSDFDQLHSSVREDRDEDATMDYGAATGDDDASEDGDYDIASPIRGRSVGMTTRNTQPESRHSARIAGNKRMRANTAENSPSEGESEAIGRRPLRRAQHQGSYQDRLAYRSESEAAPGAGTITPKKPKPAVREVFPSLPNEQFSNAHNQHCQKCGKGKQLVCCQGCTAAFHQECLGYGRDRKHLVTKIGEANFVLQCCYCVEAAVEKDDMAPHLANCQACNIAGVACEKFRTTAQSGRDSLTAVEPGKLNQAANLLWRCKVCHRAWHQHHLPARDLDSEQQNESLQDHECLECASAGKKKGPVDSLVAWRPLDGDISKLFWEVCEDDKEYLVKFKGDSHHQVELRSGAWVYTVVNPQTRKSFEKSKPEAKAELTLEEAVPADYLEADVIMSVEYTAGASVTGIAGVSQALIKPVGLTNEDANWEFLSALRDTPYWPSVQKAYSEWEQGQNFEFCDQDALSVRLRQLLTAPQVSTQPTFLQGGRLLDHQLIGLNWLLNRWHSGLNGILGDEMGLGKTLQIIAFLGTLALDFQCYPFLVVVPNSTVQNWRREFKKWAPALRAVVYFGAKHSRELTQEHELHLSDENSTQPSCHVLITSYETLKDANERRFFGGIAWQVLVADEGQELKNESSLAHKSFAALQVPCKILLTGTPLQNNAKELIDTLSLLDPQIDVNALTERHKKKRNEHFDHEKLKELQDMLLPKMLRRGKAILNLPPLRQLIVHVSMTSLQKTCYMKILEKDYPGLLEYMADSSDPRKYTITSLHNAIISLQKCVNHPFIVESKLEELDVDHATAHRNLIEASGKFKLLELLFSELQNRSHRPLIFSKSLEMLNHVEDLLIGMHMEYRRLDGSTKNLKRQQCIDEFNHSDSSVFAFLLSTRAGGVGINLATADTVIILDQDFNPQQDIQAISRAHRMGQRKPVMVFRIITRGSVEEKIMQSGQGKLKLSTAVMNVNHTGENEIVELVESLSQGLKELLEDDNSKDIVYDEKLVKILLDRAESARDDDPSVDATTTMGKVFELTGDVTEIQDEDQEDADVWKDIMQRRKANAELKQQNEANKKGHKRPRRATARYENDFKELDKAIDFVPEVEHKKRLRESDGDFQDQGLDSADDDLGDDDDELPKTPSRKTPSRKTPSKKTPSKRSPQKTPSKPPAKKARKSGGDTIQVPESADDGPQQQSQPIDEAKAALYAAVHGNLAQYTYKGE